jgi:hypothetical protein
VSGEVLTAADLSVTNSGIPVFADSTARDAAFGGTGEKTLAEGQYAYLESTKATQFYDGAAWQPVGVAPGLVLVSVTTVGTTVASVAITGAFSASYDNYIITYEDGVGSTTDQPMSMILGATTANYYYGFSGNNYSASANNGGGANTTAWSYVGIADSTYGAQMSMTIQSPFLARKTVMQTSGYAPAGTFVQGFGMLLNNTSYTGFTLRVDSGTISGGKIRVYGYANS